MKVEINKKTIEIPDKEIKQFMKSLDITEKEAVQMWLDDHDYTTNAEVEELTKKAKANKTDKIVVQSKVEKTKTERKPKENPLKQAIIQDIYNYLSKNATLYNVKIENHKTWCQLNLSGNKSVIKYLNLIYKDSTENNRLDRKYNSYIDFIKYMGLDGEPINVGCDESC